MMTVPIVRAGAAWAALLAFAISAGAQTRPYAGEQHRAIKALDTREVTALREGQGMGFARAAELNGYPGPMHVLEWADELALSDAQRVATTRLMHAHKERARALGHALIDAEAALDRLFAHRAATAPTVHAATRRVADAQAALRAEHLNTHVAQTSLLTADQVERYAALRGYRGAAPHAAPDAGNPGTPHRH